MTKMTKHDFEKAVSMTAYGLAAGALGAISLPVAAAEQDVSGLPLLVDVVTTTVGIDINGDDVDDFNVFRVADYGGGFAIGPVNVGDSSHQVLARRLEILSGPNIGYVQRNDSDEYITEQSYQSSTLSVYIPWGAPNAGSGYSKLLIEAGGLEAPYTPFRGKPGFIGLVWRGDSGTSDVTPLQPHVAYLEVVVSSDGTQLQVLSGAWQDEDYPNVIELPDVTPPPVSGLAELALGAQ